MNRQIPIVIVFALALIVVVLWTWPSYQEFSALKNQVQVKEQELENRTSYFDHLKAIEQDLNERVDELAKLDAILPDNPEIPLLYDLVQRISSGSGLVFKEIFYTIEKKEDSEAGIREITVDVSVDGSYEGIKEFLLAARKAERMLDINSVSFSAPKEGEIFKFSITISAFSY